MVNKPRYQKSLWAGSPYIYIRHIPNEITPDLCYEVTTSPDGIAGHHRLRGANLDDVTAVFMHTAGQYAAYERIDGANDIALIKRGHVIPPYIAEKYREIVHPMGTPMTDFRTPDMPEMADSAGLLEARLLTGDVFFITQDNIRHTVYGDMSRGSPRFGMRQSWDYPLYFTESSLLYAAMIAIAPIDQWKVQHVDWQAT